jgi:hypothetical protein
VAELQGTGNSFGGAIRNMLGKVSLGQARESYTRSTTVGQFRQLFGSDKGYKALSDAGLDVKQARTFSGWLDGTSQPNKANASAIDRAYKAMQRGGPPDWVKQQSIKISGEVGTGHDVRDRGGGRYEPLLINLRGTPGGWDRLDEALRDGTDDAVEEAFADEIIGEDIGDGSGGWSFPGTSYRVGS